MQIYHSQGQENSEPYRTNPFARKVRTAQGHALRLEQYFTVTNLAGRRIKYVIM